MYVLTKVDRDNQPTLATIASMDMPSRSAFVEAEDLVEWTVNCPKPHALKWFLIHLITVWRAAGPLFRPGKTNNSS